MTIKCENNKNILTGLSIMSKSLYITLKKNNIID